MTSSSTPHTACMDACMDGCMYALHGRCACMAWALTSCIDACMDMIALHAWPGHSPDGQQLDVARVAVSRLHRLGRRLRERVPLGLGRLSSGVVVSLYIHSVTAAGPSSVTAGRAEQSWPARNNGSRATYLQVDEVAAVGGLKAVHTRGRGGRSGGHDAVVAHTGVGQGQGSRVRVRVTVGAHGAWRVCVTMMGRQPHTWALHACDDM
jgi:hypothetical protein